MNKTLIYTVITNQYDRLKEPVKTALDPRLDWICFTDDPSMPSNTWELEIINGSQEEQYNPKLVQRKLKILGNEITRQYDKVMYIDGTLRVIRSIYDFIQDFEKPAFFLHPTRDNIYDEAIECIRQRKIPKDKAFEQVGSYAVKNSINKNILFQTGAFITPPRKNPEISVLFEDWWLNFSIFPYRDQLSFNAALSDFEIDKIKFNKWIKYFRQSKHRKKRTYI